MFYVIASAEALGLRLTPDEGREIVRVGEMIKAAAREQIAGIVHPENPAINALSIAQFSGPAHDPDNDMRNAVIISTGDFDWQRPDTWTGVLDRSACGTGTCARMATLHARGQLALGQPFRHESVLGTVFTGCLVEETRVGRIRPSCPRSAARPGSPASASTCSMPRIHSPRGSWSATCGRSSPR